MHIYHTIPNKSFQSRTSCFKKTEVDYYKTVASSLCGGFQPNKASPFIKASGKNPSSLN